MSRTRFAPMPLSDLIGDAKNLGSFKLMRANLPELALVSLLLNLLALALPLTLLQVYDRIIPNYSTSTLSMLVLGILLALALETLLRLARSYVTGWIGARFEHLSGVAALELLLTSKIDDVEKQGAGAQLERLNALGQIRDFYSGQALLTLLDLPFVLIFLGLIALLAGWLVAIPLGIAIIFFLMAMRLGERLRKAIKERMTSDDRRLDFVMEVLRGIHTVKSMAMEALMLRRYELLQSANAQNTYNAAYLNSEAMRLSQVFSQLTTVLIVSYGCTLVVNHELTIGGLAACTMLAGRSLQPMSRLVGVWNRFQTIRIAREKVAELLSLKREGSPDLADWPEIQGRLTLDHASFSYGDQLPDAIHDATIDIQPGECICVQGSNGSGKSTLAAMMLGIDIPQKGRVLIDGIDVRQYDSLSLKRQVAYLPQRGEVFSGTILENLTMFDPNMTDRALEVASQVGLDEVVSAMRLGYDTPIGEGVSESLPAGVVQRIAIARALASDPKIVLFDEANSSVDSVGDRYIRSAIESLRGNCTLVLITHRPSYTKLADRTFELVNGRLRPKDASSPLISSEPSIQETAGLDAASSPRASSQQISADRNTRLAENVLGRFSVPTDFANCLIALLTALNWRGDLKNVAEALPHFAETLDLTGFRNVMANLNYISRPESTRMEDIDPRLMPCLFVPDDGPAMVILRPAPDGSLLAFDGESSLIEPLAGNASSKGTAYLFFPASEENEDILIRQKQIGWFKATTERFRPLLWQIFGLTLFINIMALASPLFIMGVYDRVVPTGSFSTLGYLAAGIAIALIAEHYLSRMRSKAVAYLGGRLDYIFGNAVFQRILSLSASFTERATVGAQVGRIKEFESIRDFFNGPMAFVLFELPFVFFFLAVFTIIGGQTVFIVIIAALAFLVMGLITYPLLQRSSSLAGKSSGKRNEFLTETVGKLRVIKMGGYEQIWLERFRQISGKAAMADFKQNLIQVIVAAISNVITVSAGISVVAFCVFRVLDTSMTVGGVVAAMILVWRVLAPLQTACISMPRIERVLSSVKQIDNLMNLKPEREIRAVTRPPSRFKGHVVFSRVSFRYTADTDPALVGVSFDIQPGEVVGLIGPNGSGKSTALKLMSGLYQPQAGSIRIDNHDLRQIDPADLRSSIAYVPQVFNVFYGTIAQNLRLASPTALDEELRIAANQARVLEDIMALPEGFNTKLGESRMDHFSASFMQKLSLARAYLKRAPLMLFDEPVTGLDFTGDRYFLSMVNALRGQSTIFIVTHRPSHLAVADKVLVFQNGYLRLAGAAKDVMKQIPPDLL
ncbi:MAG: ATP-binding cassette domain-containing protein [Alphaproteobacteria bacterium]|nr:ATP-binding cassette domain-containing protein [Alphaproteobacteria bacterium]